MRFGGIFLGVAAVIVLLILIFLPGPIFCTLVIWKLFFG